MSEFQNGLEFEQDDFNIKEELVKYARHWKWFVLCTVIAVIGAVLYLRYTPAQYQTQAKIKILDESSGLEVPADIGSLFGGSKINLENEIEVLKSYRLLSEVVKELDLTTRYFYKGNIKQYEVYNLPFKLNPKFDVDSIISSLSYQIKVLPEGYQIFDEIKSEIILTTQGHTLDGEDKVFPFQIELVKSIKPVMGLTYKIVQSPVKSTVLSLSKKITIGTVGKKSEILSVGLTGQSTARSETILNAVIDQFNQDGITDRQLVFQRTIDFVDDRFVYLASELDSIEVDKRDFKTSNNIVYLEGDAEVSVARKVSSENEVYALESQIALSELLEEMLNSEKTYGLLPANIGLENANINTLVNDYNTVVLEREKLVSSAGENNPAVKLVSSQLDDLKPNIARSIIAYKKQLGVSLKQLSKVQRRAAGAVSSLPEKEKLLRAIERQQKIKETLYLLLLQKREEAAINLAVTAPSIKVVDYAISDMNPLSPKRSIVYLGALVLGLLVPFGVLYLRFLLDTKIHNKQDLEKLVPNVPIVAEIPLVEGENKIFSDPHDRSALAESFRILSTNANYLLPKRNDGLGHVVYTTSTIKGEGKTFVSLNLSLAFASMGKKVLLIGSDLRNPQLHAYVNRDKSIKGFADCLHNPELDWKTMVVKQVFGNPIHDTLFSGTIPPNPAELLTNAQFKTILDEARTQYDYVVVDTAPTILVTDTLLIAEHADATIFVTRADHTEKKIVQFSKDLYEHKKINNMAYVVNNVGASKSSQYGYGYNYGYNYGYGEDRTKGSFFKRLFGKSK
ncbi:MAG: hypothetical protein BM564_10755 [Bacteroidetes bacterium MedPE-SWsnd-G2]|nr:MAG: hypothetical protein BM564_10755 [Bacteroidetes bacterium MedPE-SWsnd-G2]